MNSVLVVDDEPLMQRVMRQKFRTRLRAGELELFGANDGLEALERLREHPQITVVLCDINMPRLDGFGLGGAHVLDVFGEQLRIEANGANR